MLVAGLARLAGLSDTELGEMVDSIGLSALHDVLAVEAASVNAISGWRSTISLPNEHHHRNLATINGIIDDSDMAPAAKQLAAKTFTTLGRAEASVHGIPFDEVTFHEVGALDSILDICVSSALLASLAPANFYCSPLPLCDGVIRCQHGCLASPAPAVQEMLRGVPVYGIASEGETITPTALAFLLAAGARFGKWPEAEVLEVARVYGGRLLPGVPNGAMFFLVAEPD
jgi:uncharacterized protein (DUF111 family)